MECKKVYNLTTPYYEIDIRKKLYDFLFDNEYPSLVLRQIETIESNGFLIESISYNGPTFIFKELGENIGEIQHVSQERWKPQMKINFSHISNIKYILVLDYLKK